MLIRIEKTFRWSCYIRHILIVHVLGLMFIKSCMSACPVNSKTYTNTKDGYEICYWKSTKPDDTFNNMHMFCRLDHGTLAFIPNQEAFMVLEQILNDLQGPFKLWIGIDDIQTEGIYMNKLGKKQSFLIWAGGDPNGGTTENCVALVNSYTMVDESCSNSYGAICSIKTDIPTAAIVADTTTITAGTTTPAGTTTTAKTTTQAVTTTQTDSTTMTETTTQAVTTTLAETTTQTETITQAQAETTSASNTQFPTDVSSSTTTDSSAASTGTAGNCSFMCNCNFHNYTEEELPMVLATNKETAAYRKCSYPTRNWCPRDHCTDIRDWSNCFFRSCYVDAKIFEEIFFEFV